MAAYITNIVYSDSENTLYCDDVRLFKRKKEIVAEIDYSSNSQLRKNTSRIKMNFEELLDNLENIKEISCEGVSKKVTRYFKSMESEPKKIRRYCLIIIGEEESKFECVFSLINDELTIKRK